MLPAGLGIHRVHQGRGSHQCGNDPELAFFRLAHEARVSSRPPKSPARLLAVLSLDPPSFRDDFRRGNVKGTL